MDALFIWLKWTLLSIFIKRTFSYFVIDKQSLQTFSELMWTILLTSTLPKNKSITNWSFLPVSAALDYKIMILKIESSFLHLLPVSLLSTTMS